MKKYWGDIKTSFIIFAIWRLLLFIVSFTASKILVYKDSFPYVNKVLEPTYLPSWIYAFGNFDGVHYLRIAQNGYKDAFYQAFFPLYPLLIRIFNVFPEIGLDKRVFVEPTYFYTGIILSNIFLFFSLIVINKLVKKKDYLITVLLLLCFPTAFYFGAIYTESLFLFELLLFMYFLKRKKYLSSAFVAFFASATRLIGILFSLVILVELVKNLKDQKYPIDKYLKQILAVVISALGLLFYMLYQYKNYGNPFAFIFAQPGFGAGREAMSIILLPQVFYRYFKMFITITNNYQLFTTSIEFISALVGLYLIIWSFRKISVSWWLFCLLVYLLPTLTGTFSSMPRYILFEYVALIPIITRATGKFRLTLIVIMILLQVVFLAFFVRGYWIS